MSYVEKNKGRIILIVIAFLVIISLIIYGLQKRFFINATDLKCSVYPYELYAGDTLFYKDDSEHSKSIKWDFGDGGISLNKKGYHLFNEPGFYQVTYIIDNKVSKSFSIEVKRILEKKEKKVMAYIEAPDYAMQDENVVFRAVTDKAAFYSWKFGESGSIDAKEDLVIYSYKQPGEYEVSLFTDEMVYPITHIINILPSFKNMNESLTVEDSFKEIDDDFKFHLQQIANGASFNTHYNYLVTSYLCSNENARIETETNKSNTFYYYCMGLKFDKNVVIQSVKVGFDDALNCITNVNIVQYK